MERDNRNETDGGELTKPFRLMALLVVACAMAAQAGAQTTLDRTALPIPEPNYPHETELDARKATPVTEDYQAYDNKFTGKIHKVTVDVKPMGAGEKAAAGKANAEAAKKVEETK